MENEKEPMTRSSIESKIDLFSIEILEQDDNSDNWGTMGQIRVGKDFCERFSINFSFWSPKDYRLSWTNALRNIDKSSTSTSCLIASITDPENSNFVSCWPMYRYGDVVYVQNSLIFLDQLSEPFNPEHPWNHIQPHQEVSDDGTRISQWTTSISAVREFRRDY
ncbi:hypothetical protein [Actinoalloteichus caeruleus]|uniref:hypothetical protein n=2 Tax=Actinoalloteichus cyanogriseus TaxID=2893586 RepID=UPI001B801CD6|nr:hypothetical protein [Actinoalloteichus caeruleus]